MKLKDETGNKFGKLSVIKYAGRNRTSAQWECLCDCGNTVVVVGNKLRSGHTKSCSCDQKSITSAAFRKHGGAGTPEYKCWKSMKERCSNKNNISYANYGGKGINVCERWINNFENFLSDMGNMPSKNLTVERVNPLLGYSPENCKWASKAEQCRNTSRNVFITFKNQRKVLAEWIRYFGISYHRFYYLQLKFGLEETLIKLDANRNSLPDKTFQTSLQPS